MWLFRCFVFPPSDTSSLNEPARQTQVEKLNRQNTEHFHGNTEADIQTVEDRGRRPEPAELILEGTDASDADLEQRKKAAEEKKEEQEEDVFEDSEEEEKSEDVSPAQAEKDEDDGKKKHEEEVEESKSETALNITAEICKSSLQPQERFVESVTKLFVNIVFLFCLFMFLFSFMQFRCQLKSKQNWAKQNKNELVFLSLICSSEDVGDVATCSKRRVTEEDLVKDDLKKSRVEDSEVENADGQVVEGGKPQASKSDEAKTEAEEEGTEGESAVKEFIIGETVFTVL